MTSEFLSSNYAKNLRIVSWQSFTLLHCKTLNILPVHYITHLSVIVTSLTFLLQLNHSPVCYNYITHLSVTVTSVTCLLQLHHSPVCYNYITHLSVTATSHTCLLQLHHSPFFYNSITHLSGTITSLTCLLQLHHSPVCYTHRVDVVDTQAGLPLVCCLGEVDPMLHPRQFVNLNQ